MRSIGATAASVALIVAACGDETSPPVITEEADETTTTTEATTTTTEAETTTTEAETTTTTEASTAGSREAPIPQGDVASVGVWEVTFAPTDRDATQAVLAENQLNEPPPEGSVFIMAEVTVTYLGHESGTPWLDLQFDFVDAAGNTRGTSGEDYCGVIPNNLGDVGEMFTDASASGNVCAVVAADQIEGGAWIVEELFSFDDTRVFFGL